MKHHGQSGRVVVDLEPNLKRRLYSSLALSGTTLKEWLTKSAEELCEEISPYSASVRQTKSVSEAEESASKTFSVVSMFSGCGGMDLGFCGGFNVFGRHYPKLPFKITWANDLNEAACRTYQRNVGQDIHCGDIWKYLATMPEKTDILIGGFPCQDISVNGLRKGVSGARSGLYKAMVEAIKKTKPKVFVAENVKGLLMDYNRESLEQILTDFDGLGYVVHYQLYKAADYGVPQTRERVFFVGTSSELKPFIPPDSERNASNWMTAKEAIGDLESLMESPEINHIWSRANRSPEQGDRRLIPGRPGYTIRAECHGNIQFHYSQPRRISMREAARFQSFPDSFFFDAGIRETERMIGNAVPPVLAWHVASAILDILSIKVIHHE